MLDDKTLGAIRILGNRSGTKKDDPQVRMNLSDSAGDIVPGYIEWSVFELVGAEYDLRFDPNTDLTEQIRGRAKDRTSFRRVRDELKLHVLLLDPGAEVFRLRRHDSAPSEPWPAEGMLGHPAPPPYRANLRGEPTIYCADSIQTASAEVRSHPGQHFTLAIIDPIKPLRLVDLRGRRMQGLHNPFATIDLWMSRPVDRDGDWPEPSELHNYSTTQLFASIVRVEGYDGIVFSSSVHAGGSNFAVFDPSSLRVVKRTLWCPAC